MVVSSPSRVATEVKTSLQNEAGKMRDVESELAVAEEHVRLQGHKNEV